MSEPVNRNLHPRILVCIVPVSREKQMRAIFREQKIPIFYECYAHGTAPSETLDILGIGESSRLVTMTFVPQVQVRSVIEAINGSMSLWQRGAGIGFSIRITGMQKKTLLTLRDVLNSLDEDQIRAIVSTLSSRRQEMIRSMSQEEKQQAVHEILTAGTEEEMNETKAGAAYAAVCVLVTKGYSDDVMTAARSAGARGGTVLRGNRSVQGEPAKELGLPQQSEQEIVLLLVPKDKKTSIMSAVSEACGLGTDARGIVISLPVDEVMGISG